MATKPTASVAWAQSDIVDGTSGQNNKVQPPASYETEGWSYNETPARNYDNYNKNAVGAWIEYLDAATVRGPTYKVAAADATTDAKNQADAVCDGTADDFDINFALATVEAAGGGTVVLSEGTFQLAASVMIRDNTHLLGMGVGATTLFLTAGASDPYLVAVTGANNGGVARMSLDGNRASRSVDDSGIIISTGSDITFRDLEIFNVGQLTSAGGDGVQLNIGSNMRFDAVKVQNCDGDGFAVESQSGSYASFTRCSASSCGGNGFYTQGVRGAFSDCYALSCLLSGFAEAGPGISGALYSSYSGCEVSNCGTSAVASAGMILNSYARASGCHVAGQNGGDGIEVIGEQSVLTGCRVDATAEESGIVLAGIQSIASGCVSSGNQKMGFELGANYAATNGCIAFGNTDRGFEIGGAIEGAVISGCTATGNTADGVDIRGTECIVTGTIARANSENGFESSGVRCIITGCTAAGNAHDGIHVEGGDAFVTNNYVVGNGTAGSTGYNGINMAGSTQAVVLNNVVRQGAGLGGNGQEFGVLCGVGTNVSGNDLLASSISLASADAISGSPVTTPRYLWNGSANEENSEDNANRVTTQ